MKITLSFDGENVNLFEPLDIHIVFENDTNNPIWVDAFGFHPNFQGSALGAFSAMFGRPEKLDPGESLKREAKLPIDVSKLTLPNTLGKLSLSLKVSWSGIDQGQQIDGSADFDYEFLVNMQDSHLLCGPDDEPTEWYRHGRKIYCFNPRQVESYSYFRELKLQADKVRIYDHKYIGDDTRIYLGHQWQKSVSAAGFKVFNPLFAGDKTSILTAYGLAKVDDPESFEVLDDGCEPSVFSSEMGGYKFGYGRDTSHVYCFDESTSTTHAIKVRACKTPETFESLGYTFGRDAKAVYFEGKKITKARPETFQVLNRYYSRDDRYVFYMRDIVEGADVETFQILPTDRYPDRADPLLSSKNAMDKSNEYVRGMSREAYIKLFGDRK